MASVQLQLIDARRATAWTVGPAGARIGRATPCEIAIPSLQVSREHAHVRFRDGAFFIDDLGSRNGTRVNDRPVGPSGRRLVDGDIVTLADAVTLTARLVEPMSSARVVVDSRRGEAWVGPVQVTPALTSAQLGLLALLLRASGQIIAHAAVVDAAWPGVDPVTVDAAAVAQLVSRIEGRLQSAGWTGSLGTVTAAGGIRSAIFDELRKVSAA